jgi:hypothetical protein
LIGVEGLIATAFQPALVIIIDCELPGKTPSDHDDASSQAPLAGLIQEFTCAETEVKVSAIIVDATKPGARPIPAVRHRVFIGLSP